MIRQIPIILLLLIMLLPTLPGCQGREVDTTTAALGMGADLENGQIKMSIQMAKPVAPQTAGTDNTFVVASGTGATANEAAKKIYLTIPRYTLWSHSSVFLLGENLANQDLSLIIDILARNVDIRKSSQMFITSEYTPEEILQSKSPMEPTSSLGVKDLIEIQEEILGIYTGISLGEFISSLSTTGIDPLVPQVTLVKQGKEMIPTLKGAAAFRGQQMAGSLNEKETQGYRFLKTGIKHGGMIIISSPISNTKNKVTLEVLRCQTKSQALVSGNQILIQIRIEAEGNFYEQNCTDPILTPENIKIMEQSASQEIERLCNAAIARAQSLRSDIFGWGRQVEDASSATFKQLSSDWNDVFPQIEADVKVNFSIRRTYLTDRSFEFAD